MATKLSDVLQQESSGIMFPFKTSVKPVTTEQKVYTPTDGIMSVTGKAYEGPDAVVKYGTPEQSYQRQLKQIEGPMLPQFDQKQFPKAGEGRVEAPPLPPTTPVEPITEEPAFDPCPPGFKLVNGVCQPIQRGGEGRGRQTPTIDLKNFTKGLSKAEGAINAGGLNSMRMMQLEEKYGAEAASQIGLMNQKYGNKGALVEEAKDANGKPILVDGKIQVKNIIPTPPENFSEALNHLGIGLQDLIKQTIPGRILTAIGVDEKKAPKKLSPELQKKFEEYYEKSKSVGPPETTSRPTQPATGDTRDFGQLGSGEFTSLNKSIEYFGQLNRDRDVLQMEIDAINQMLEGENLNLPRVKAKFKDSITKRDRTEKKLKDIEEEIKQAEDDARQTSEKLAASDRQAASKIASDYNSRVNERAEKRRKESEARRKVEATKTTEQRQSEKEQRSSNFRNMSRSIASFRDRFK